MFRVRLRRKALKQSWGHHTFRPVFRSLRWSSISCYACGMPPQSSPMGRRSPKAMAQLTPLIMYSRSSVRQCELAHCWGSSLALQYWGIAESFFHKRYIDPMAFPKCIIYENSVSSHLSMGNWTVGLGVADLMNAVTVLLLIRDFTVNMTNN